MTRKAARNACHILIRVFNYAVVSAMSTSAEVILNLILAVLRYYIMILLTLVASHNVIFLRVDINIVILII